MSATAENLTEFAMKLRLTKRASDQLAERANKSGRDVADIASDLIERAINQPTVDEVLAPFRAQVAESGMSDEKLDEFFEGVREKAFQERQGRSK